MTGGMAISHRLQSVCSLVRRHCDAAMLTPPGLRCHGRHCHLCCLQMTEGKDIEM